MKTIFQHNVAAGGACMPCGPTTTEMWDRIARLLMNEAFVKDSLSRFINNVVGIPFTGGPALPNGGTFTGGRSLHGGIHGGEALLPRRKGNQP
ncbi:MAG: hypothetical protein ACAH80_08665 [Alphaproteobacteria bacterium]